MRSQAHGVTVQSVMTDNGAAYKSKLFVATLNRHGVAHERTRPYTPKTNGKAERFIHSSIREWAYATPSKHSPNVITPCIRGCTITILHDHTQPSAKNHPSPD